MLISCERWQRRSQPTRIAVRVRADRDRALLDDAIGRLYSVTLVYDAGPLAVSRERDERGRAG